MARAKGVLPTSGDDREVLYKNPDTAAHFIGVRLADGMTADQIQSWIRAVDGAIATLVARDATDTRQHPDGRKVAAVAAGFAPTFFNKMTAAGLNLELPSGFAPESAPVGDSWLPGVAPLAVDVLFYVAATRQTRVNEFLAALWAAAAGQFIELHHAYQRSDDTEVFGYRDGVRNIEASKRAKAVFVDVDGLQPDEPAWAHGGTYMVAMKIRQNPAAFAGLADDAARDAVMGRTKAGLRVDKIASGTDPREEGPEEAVGLPPASHVRKSGPRGGFDDTQIFRRGMPYMDVVDGSVEVGLHFCSFQATLAQFDTVFSEWMMNHRFPADGTGPDALLNPSNGFTTIIHGGTFFVPPSHPDGLAATFAPRPEPPATTGRLTINKLVVSTTDPSGRFRRGGFSFHIQGPDGAIIPDSEFVTSSSGRGVCPVELDLNVNYTLVETGAPPEVAVTLLPPTAFTLVKPRTVMRVVNELTAASNAGY